MHNAFLSFVVFVMVILVSSPSFADEGCDSVHPGKLSVNVTNEHHKPMQGVKLIIIRPPSDGRDNGVIEATTDHKGHYQGSVCAGIFKGRVSTQLSKKGYYTIWRGYIIKPNGKVALKVQMHKIPLLTAQDLKYRASHYTHQLKPKIPTEFNEGVKGVITDLDGNPIANVPIRFEPVSPLDFINVEIENNTYTFIHAYSMSDGSFQQVLPPGIYDVIPEIEEPGGYTAQKQIFVRPKVISTLNFALENPRK